MKTRSNFARHTWQNFNWFLAPLVLALAGWARAETPPAAIPFSDIGGRATASYQGDALGITATPEGARLRCGFQKLEGHATAQGLWLESTAAGGGRLRLTAIAISRPGLSTLNPPPSTALATTGTVSVQDNLVLFVRPGLTEEYSVSVDGVRQDFVIESPPLYSQPSTLNQSSGDLRVELAVSGARAEAVACGARLMLEGSERVLAYSRLRAEDATGRELAARLEVLAADRLAVSVADANATYPVRIDPTFSDADWVGLGSGMGGYGGSAAVYALAVSGTKLYVGGSFSTAGGVWADNIAKWDRYFWSALSGGVSAAVHALAASGTDLYVGGNFATAGGVSATNIAKWNGSAWSALGSGLVGRVRALAVSGTDLYVGGEFTMAGGVPAARIARWDGSAWSSLGSGISGGPSPGVYALAVSGSNLYAGGWFTTAGGVTVNGIAEWDGSTWSALGSGMSGVGAIVEALAVSGTDLFAGGYFTYAGGVETMYIAKWDGSTWSALGSGVNDDVSALTLRGTDLYAGGAFTTAGGLPARYVAKWNGCSWSALGSGLGGVSYPHARALAADGAGHLFVGGAFVRAGTNSCTYIAQANVGPCVPPVPVFVSPPTNQSTLIGGEADFSVVACSTLPVGYQWFFVNDAILGATNARLQLTNVQPSQAGAYTVIVTNASGAVTSPPAILDVLRRGTVVVATEAALRAAMAEGGAVTFACDGTIALSSTITNDLDVTLDATGHQVTISGGNAVRVFTVNTNVHFTAINLAITDGTSFGGSGILNLGGTVNLTGVTFAGNTATLVSFDTDALSPKASGGAIFNRGGTVNATNCSFTGNSARTPYGSLDMGPVDGLVYGGAIRNEAGWVALQACAFLGNQASGGAAFSPYYPGDPAKGGAIHNSGTVTLDLCTFAGNSAAGGAGGGPTRLHPGGAGGEGSGGAIFNEGTLTADRATFCGNAASGGTGGPGGVGDPQFSMWDGYAGGSGGYARGGAICGGTLWISRSTLVSNVVAAGNGGSGGGGSSSYPPDPHFGGNGAAGGDGASGNGGAVVGSGSLVNCTIAFNSGSGGAGGRGGGGGLGYTSGGSGGAGGNGGSGVGGVGGVCLSNCTVAWNRGNGGRGGTGGTLEPGSAGGVPGANGIDGGAWGGTASSTLVNTLITSNTPAGGDTFADPRPKTSELGNRHRQNPVRRLKSGMESRHWCLNHLS